MTQYVGSMFTSIYDALCNGRGRETGKPQELLEVLLLVVLSLVDRL